MGRRQSWDLRHGCNEIEARTAHRLPSSWGITVVSELVGLTRVIQRNSFPRSPNRNLWAWQK
jgi:hypothetical protein